MNKDQLNAAKLSMNEWFKNSNELGKDPFRIECTKEFDLHEMHYYVFRFKEKFFE